ncbi:MAG: hypothetical protein L6Q57_01860 [Alphaproteobacteria bacterium]|nr:hypothetical protein [Alphaproteobacteria bacterium]
MPIKGTKILRLSLLSALLLALFTITAPPAEACCNCPATAKDESSKQWKSTEARLKNHYRSELTAQRVWITSVLWEDNILPALMLMAEQFSTVAMQQVQIFGTFLDAGQQMETQQTIQRLRAQAHKDYHPSEGLCQIGSAAKSLAASERKGEFTAVVLAQRSQDRQLGQTGSAAATGYSGDIQNRLAQFKEKYCDPLDNNSGLGYLCDHGGGNIGAADPARSNRDIDYVATLAAPWTLDVDFTDAKINNGEEDILALASNLYGHEVFRRPTVGLESQAGKLSATQRVYMDMRSLLAKRSVAENSFNAIAGMKAAGSGGSNAYLQALLKDLGLENDAELKALLGDNPSYYAQMEVLAKKIYQNPDFYTNLYDKPANVDRKGVALQAIGLMQKFDLFKSYLRNEASLSVLLELSLMDIQDQIENQTGWTQ